MKRILYIATLLIVIVQPIAAERIKDITSVAGVRNNQLIGYGLVVGLNGTGDKTGQTPFTLQSFRTMLEQFGVTIPENVNPQLKNVAAVVVHADLPPFAKPGQNIDITVSSIGNAESLHGGSLLFTPLRGADGNVYAIGQGNLIVGGFGASGADGSRISVNVPSVGRIPNGAVVERMVPTPFAMGDSIVLNLDEHDFTTAKRIADRINRLIGPNTASSLDGISIRVKAPREQAKRVSFLSVIENLEVSPGEGAAKVVVNSRTGTIVIGKNVRVGPAAIAHGSLTVTITENPVVSQPEPFSGGETVVTPSTDIQISEEESRMFKIPQSTTLDDIVRAVNQVGMAPGDLMAILEGLKQAGALRAELVVI